MAAQLRNRIQGDQERFERAHPQGVALSLEKPCLSTFKRRQGQTGRVFQVRVGISSCIEKIFWVGSGRSGYLYQIPSQLGIMGF